MKQSLNVAEEHKIADKRSANNVKDEINSCEILLQEKARYKSRRSRYELTSYFISFKHIQAIDGEAIRCI